MARSVCLLGARTTIVCRNLERGEAMRDTIQSNPNNRGTVTVKQLDISKPKDVAQFCRDYEESGEPLHCLVNNAGCMVTSYSNWINLD